MSRKAEIPMQPFPISSWRSRLQPTFPSKIELEQRKLMTQWKHPGGLGRGQFCVEDITFGVVEMDGSEVVESHFLIKLIKHGFHSTLCSQVISYKSTSSHGTVTVDFCITTTLSSTEGINYLQTLQGLWQVGEKTKHQLSLTCSKGMAGIQTHSHSGLVSHFIDDAPQLREGAPHRATLAAHILQHWVHGGEATITLTHQSCKYLVAEASPGGDCATFPAQGIVQLHQQHLMVFLCNLFLKQLKVCAPRQVEIPKITSE